MKTSVSILKSNDTIEKCIEKVELTDTDFIHVDIMDGKFVERTTLSINDVNNLFYNSSKPLDIHLMVESPREYIEAFKDLNVFSITIHVEIEENIEELLNLIKRYGIKAGIAINPETDINKLNNYLSLADLVLIMGVHPGAGGQKLKFSTTERIEYLSELRLLNRYHYLINFDGGVNNETRHLLDGLDMLVSGSYVCMSDDYQARINELR